MPCSYQNNCYKSRKGIKSGIESGIIISFSKRFMGDGCFRWYRGWYMKRVVYECCYWAEMLVMMLLPHGPHPLSFSTAEQLLFMMSCGILIISIYGITTRLQAGCGQTLYSSGHKQPITINALKGTEVGGPCLSTCILPYQCGTGK